VATPSRKKQDYVANRKRKKTNDIVDVVAQLVTYATQKCRVVFM
jgi:hypothetical protein